MVSLDHWTAFFIYRTLVKVSDAAIVIASWYFCWYFRFIQRIIPITKGLPDFELYAQASFTLMLTFVAVFHMIGVYRHDRIHFGLKAIRKIIQACLVSTLCFVSLSYFEGNVNYSRAFLLLFLAVVVVALLLGRGFLQIVWYFTQGSRAVKKIRVLLVGSGELLEMFYHQITARKPYPVSWVGRLGARDCSIPESEVPYLGTEANLLATLANYEVSQVVVAFSADKSYAQTLELLSNELVSVKVIPDFGKYSTFRYSATHECGIPLLLFNHSPMGATDHILKRVGDVVFATVFLILFSPLYALIALLVRLSSPGPIIYSQQRVGADGRIFTCYKFRSMHTDAESTSGPVWATPGDGRTTWIGKWLRRSSLDELPQMVNVLIGNMSLIGPRPERPIFVDQFKHQIPKYMLRHRMKSGLTGWAQINGLRGNTSLEERIKYDLYYIGQWSHWLDFKILSLTPWTLLKGLWKGYAY